MLKIYTSYLFIISMIITFVGCGTKSELDGLDEYSYKIVKQRQDFEKSINPDINFEIDKDSDKTLLMLLDADVKIMYRIAMPNIRQVTFAKLQEHKNLNIDKLLINSKDYYFDSVNKALYLALEIPYIYLLDNKLSLDLNLYMISDKKKFKTRDIKLNFETKPMSDNGKKYLSFKYKNSINDEDIDPFILTNIKKEVQSSNLKRFSSKYKKEYAKVLGLD